MKHYLAATPDNLAWPTAAAIEYSELVDDGAIVAAVAARCFYIGALGSRKTHIKRRQRLGEQGLNEAALDRLHAPIGLDIKARSPAEIAVAILAEIIAALRSRGLPAADGSDVGTR